MKVYYLDCDWAGRPRGVPPLGEPTHVLPFIFDKVLVLVLEDGRTLTVSTTERAEVRFYQAPPKE